LIFQYCNTDVVVKCSKKQGRDKVNNPIGFVVLSYADKRDYIKHRGCIKNEVLKSLIEQIKSLDPVESMYLVKNIINSLDNIKL